MIPDNHGQSRKTLPPSPGEGERTTTILSGRRGRWCNGDFDARSTRRGSSCLYQSPGEAEKDVRLAIAVEWYRRGVISQGKAAELAGVPRADFIDELAARKLDVIQVDFDELRRVLGE